MNSVAMHWVHEKEWVNKKNVSDKNGCSHINHELYHGICHIKMMNNITNINYIDHDGISPWCESVNLGSFGVEGVAD